MMVQELIDELESWKMPSGEIRFVNERDEDIDYIGIAAVTFRTGSERVTVAFNCESAYEK